jgi:hypothetical protein
MVWRKEEISAEDVQPFSERYMAFVFFTHGNV